MKSFHLSGPKFDIAVEKFCLVEFSNFLLGQKFVTVEFSIRSEIRRGQNQIRILQRVPTSSHAKPTHQSLTLFCMN